MNTKDYVNTTEAAKILGVSQETVRRRIKAGKLNAIKDLNGKLWIAKSDLGITSTPPVVNLTKVIFVVDCSGSMNGNEKFVHEAIKSQCEQLSAASTDLNKFEVTYILFGSRVDANFIFRDVKKYDYPAINSAMGMTALNDAIHSALSFVEVDCIKTNQAFNPGFNVAYLVVVVTDGDENASRLTKTHVNLLNEKLKKTDRLTLVINCPPGREYTISNDYGVSASNVTSFVADKQGIATMATNNTSAISRYGSMRSAGVTYSTNYFVDLQGDPNAVAIKLNNVLNDVTAKVDCKRVASGDPVQIRDFSKKKFGVFDKGSVFYELNKTEKVQDYKQIIVQDKTTGKFFHGWDAARKLLKLPNTGEIKVSPGNLGEFKLFVQSTSVNRKLEPGTAVVLLK